MSLLRFLTLSLTAFTLQAHAGSELRWRKDVLPGLLIRAGGAGGMHSLPDTTVTHLCEEGFSAIYYLYPSVSFPNAGTHSCTGNSVDYLGAGFTAHSVRPIFQRVLDVATHGGGPIMIHCWNGWHASGEVSAYALIQFCGYSGEQAAQYWASTIADPRNLGKYGKVLDRIRNFTPFNELRFDNSLQTKYCPR